MGGPMGVGDQGEVEWLASEIEYIRDLVESDVPVWGVCLGSQLLAAALGARVYTGAVPEVGVEEITLTVEGRQDPVWGDLPSTFPAMQWHSDTFDIPERRGAARWFSQVSESTLPITELQSSVSPRSVLRGGARVDGTGRVPRFAACFAGSGRSAHLHAAVECSRVAGTRDCRSRDGEMVEIHLHRISPFCPD